ncbi:MAG: sulfotransferase [Acidocella sp.]|nr:sulfotransferase [Acidocella sp.]
MKRPLITAWAYRALGPLFALADRKLPSSWRPDISPRALIAASGTAPGVGARDALARLLAAVGQGSDLSFFGQLSLRWDMIRLLRNAALVESAHATRPALSQTPVAAPIFILGLPRSGTSFLHALMAEDSANHVPRAWQTIYPAPRPAGFDAKTDRRARTVDRQFRIFEALAPGFLDLHPITADSPQECTEITAHVFQSLRFDTTFRVPGYRAWLDTHGHLEAFSFHKQFLQYLQNGEPARWVLKCPDHTFSLEAILATYPDARFIIVHRDPIAVLGSVARLTEILRTPFLRRIDTAEIGAQVGARWIAGANLLLDFDLRPDIPAARKIHLHYDDLTGAPLATIARIYEQFDMALSPAAIAAMSRRIAARPYGGYARHAAYSLDPFALSVEAMRAQFAPYVSQYCRDYL